MKSHALKLSKVSEVCCAWNWCCWDARPKKISSFRIMTSRWTPSNFTLNERVILTKQLSDCLQLKKLFLLIFSFINDCFVNYKKFVIAALTFVFAQMFPQFENNTLQNLSTPHIEDSCNLICTWFWCNTSVGKFFKRNSAWNYLFIVLSLFGFIFLLRCCAWKNLKYS